MLDELKQLACNYRSKLTELQHRLEMVDCDIMRIEKRSGTLSDPLCDDFWAEYIAQSKDPVKTAKAEMIRKILKD